MTVARRVFVTQEESMSTTKLPASPVAGFLGRLLRAWDRFWFRPGDPTTLGLVRICCGLIVLYIHVAYSWDLQEFFGKDAWVTAAMMDEFRTSAPAFGPPAAWDNTVPPRAKSQEEEEYTRKWGGHPSQSASFGQWRWSIWYHVTDPTWMRIIHGGILTCMFLFLIGFCTRLTGVLSWLGMLSYVHRSPTSLFGMDNIMNVVMLYLVIGPSGAALSVDRLIARYWASYQALRRHKPAPLFGPPARTISANFALRLLQVHICIVYIISGTSKLQGGVWWSGNAIWMTMANYEFSPMDNALYMAFLRLLSEHRWLWELFMTGGTFFTLIFEISFAYLIWNRRLRWTMIVCAVLLHLGIAICMGLVAFSMIMLTAVLSFVPGQTVRQLLWQLGRGRSVDLKVVEPQARAA
jgi:hypothetical protein